MERWREPVPHLLTRLSGRWTMPEYLAALDDLEAALLEESPIAGLSQLHETVHYPRGGLTYGPRIADRFGAMRIREVVPLTVIVVPQAFVRSASEIFVSLFYESTGVVAFAETLEQALALLSND
ncbi:MAG: hypothetical protein ACFB51_06105 [Anaerolineae bacterium]